MPMTRARATALLNQREMALYDDSRTNAIRALTAKALSSRIERARAARDRARDLAKRQKLSSRDRTGSKHGTSGRANQRSDDKVELMADILRRFEVQAKATPSAGVGKTAAKKAKKAPARKTGKTARRATSGAAAGLRPTAKTSGAAKKTAAKKTAAKKAVTKKAVAKKTVPKKVAAKKAVTKKKTATRKAATAKAAGDGRTSSSKKVAARKKADARKPLTPRQALKRTRTLLEEKKARDRAPKPWQSAPHGDAVEGRPGYQSGVAADRAQQLHDAEARLPAIMGSSSTRDRIQQGKRDHRRDKGD